MKNTIWILSAFVLAFSLATALSHAAAPPATPSKGALQNDLLAVFGETEKKVLSLADTVPQSKYGWRPAPGVRSIAEAYLHIAFGNYGLTKMATGKEPPADAKWEMNPTKWDAQTTDKAEIRKILEKSFAHVHQVIAAFPDADLEKKVNFFGHEVTARSVLIVLVGHVGEHLGQEIAYARSNKVTPPWSKTEK
jgi:uncharacterized damage-inducible protein DinB